MTAGRVRVAYPAGEWLDWLGGVNYHRNLLGAGLRSKKGRGRGAPSVTARDIAHLITAMLASDIIL